MATGDWWKHGVVYQVYPRSFQDTNGDGIGDLPGITARLDHLNDGTPRSLGVDAIWISPFYPSPMRDFGYDVSDYCDVSAEYGTLADFDELLHEAHARSIRVIVDIVPNHTSSDHPWFVASRSGRDDPKRDWYVWRDPAPGGGPPNNWLSAFGRGRPAWTLDERTGQYYLHSFLPEQPDLNYWNPDVRFAMEDVFRFWLDRGVDGFRIDVANKVGFDPDLADNPPGWEDGLAARHDEDWPAVHEILRGFRRVLDRYDDRMAVGEIAFLDPKRVASYYGTAGDELHLAFNFSFLRCPWSAEAFRAATDTFESVLPGGAWPDYTLSNHDCPRARSRYDLGDGTSGLRRARVGALMLLTLRGTPFLYYGEEIGMRDGVIPPERIVDVDGRDPERTPMQWDASPNAGFTTGTPWLPVADGSAELNVDAERDDPGSLFAYVRGLIWWRRGSAALRWGSYRPLDGSPPGIFAYVRESGDERLLVGLNFTGETVSLDTSVASIGGMPTGLPPTGTIVLATDPERQGGRTSLRPLVLGPDEGLVIDVGEPPIRPG